MNSKNLIVLLALALVASGCQQQAIEATKADKVADTPLLVIFVDKVIDGQARKCPDIVIQMIESCPLEKKGSGVACRKPGKNISWISVSGDAPPYAPDPGLPQFKLQFKNDSPVKGKCDWSENGVLECKIDTSAKSGAYDYGVYTEVAGCEIDPRIYVE